MDDKVYFRDLWLDPRARVYLLWAAITTVGYITTHYYQNKNINFVWFALAVIGFGFMYKVMPLRVVQMKRIFTAWLIPISFGIIVSIIAVRLEIIPEIVPYLGVFWLSLQALAFVWNGLVDRPAKWYFAAAALNVAAAALCYFVDSFLDIQYLIAAIVTAWSMINLWIFRTEI